MNQDVGDRRLVGPQPGRHQQRERRVLTLDLAKGEVVLRQTVGVDQKANLDRIERDPVEILGQGAVQPPR